jgi:hypothetical protein
VAISFLRASGLPEKGGEPFYFTPPTTTVGNCGVPQWHGSMREFTEAAGKTKCKKQKAVREPKTESGGVTTALRPTPSGAEQKFTRSICLG